MNIQEEKEWVMSRHSRSHGLEPLRHACMEIGNPQDRIKVIHTAGTNGKGSVCRAVQNILTIHGCKTGLFTSPHLVDHLDRIRIDDAWIPAETFHDYLQRFMNLILRYDLGMFEIDCLIAFAWFYEEKVDYAVIECGLGGRLDNTNVIQAPVLSIITTIGFDHMNILGSRIEQIAFEKAGILHPGLPAVTGRIQGPAFTVIRRHAWRIHSPLHACSTFRSAGIHTFMYDGDLYKMSTGAQYQKANLSLALEACRMLGINIHDKRTHQAVFAFQWQGRFEKAGEHPDIILDGAHNEEGMQALTASFSVLKRPLTVVFSALRDKPGKRMAAAYAKTADHLIITQFNNMRADTADDLYVQGADIETDWHEAVKRAVQDNPEGTVVITGSLYFVSLVRDWLTVRK